MTAAPVVVYGGSDYIYTTEHHYDDMYSCSKNVKS